MRLTLHYGDLVDSTNLIRIVQEVQPDEVYNLAAQSHVRVSLTPRIHLRRGRLGHLEALGSHPHPGLGIHVQVYQASSSELFGKVQESPQSETTPFYPRSPYGVAKLYAFWIVKNYRESYGMHASNGILFNHESPLRGETFVTRKITRAVARIKLDMQDCLHLGNLDAQRDWGHARDYVEGMWRMLQQDTPDDYVLATGVTTTIREFATMAFAEAGIQVSWRGQGLNEEGYCPESGHVLVKVDPRYFRPAEVDVLIGDASKAQAQLGWKASCTLQELCREMVQADLKLVQRTTT